jgi:arylsulfatase I/J
MYGGLVPPSRRGQTLDGYIHMADFFQTYCAVAGIVCEDAPQGLPPLDSLNLWPYLSGAENSSRRTDMILQFFTLALYDFHSLRGNVAAIQGDYKLVFGYQEDQALWTGPQFPNGSATGRRSKTLNRLLHTFSFAFLLLRLPQPEGQLSGA